MVEIEPDLVEWMRDGTIPHGAQLLADDRARVVVADVATAVAEAAPASYDVVLLDVDNGPGHLVHQANEALYREPFLTSVRERLSPGGVVVIWSAAREAELADDLASRLRRAEEHSHDVRLQDRDDRYWLYAGRRDPAG